MRGKKGLFSMLTWNFVCSPLNITKSLQKCRITLQLRMQKRKLSVFWKSSRNARPVSFFFQKARPFISKVWTTHYISLEFL